MKCTKPKCKEEVEIILIGEGLCGKHWNEHCGTGTDNDTFIKEKKVKKEKGEKMARTGTDIKTILEEIGKGTTNPEEIEKNTGKKLSTIKIVLGLYKKGRMKLEEGKVIRISKTKED